MRRIVACVLIVLLVVPPSHAWNATGHRIITYLALDGLPAEAPSWLREAAVRDRIAHQSNLPDRWRGTSSNILHHENKPDHYLDVELLDQFGLTLETVPPLRYEYLRALAVAKHVHPEQVEPYDASKDPDRTKEWPGMGLHAVAEHYAKLQMAFKEVRMLEHFGDAKQAPLLEQARANAIYHMGVLSHFVGDFAQPLHTTKHFNGWVGENPNGYTTSNRFHSYIDGGVLRQHDITYETMRAVVKYQDKVDPRDPWQDTLKYVRTTFDAVEPLYRMEKDGSLNEAPGKAFIESRLSAGASMLSAMYWAAWVSSAPNEKDLSDYVMYDERRNATGDMTPASRASTTSSQPSP